MHTYYQIESYDILLILVEVLEDAGIDVFWFADMQDNEGGWVIGDDCKGERDYGDGQVAGMQAQHRQDQDDRAHHAIR